MYAHFLKILTESGATQGAKIRGQGTDGPGKHSKFKVDFDPFSPRNRGYTCNPGTPTSATPTE